MITRVNMRSIEEMATRLPTLQKSRKEISKRTWMRRWRDKIRLWRDKGYLTDAVAIMFLFGTLVAAFCGGLIIGASR